MRELQAARGAAITAHAASGNDASDSAATGSASPRGGLLTLQLIHNPGAAFSLGENFTVVLTAIAASALVFVSWRLIPRVRHRGWAVGLGLLLAGILGNLTDRLIRPPGVARGHVVDFLQLPNFAIFNVADMCITFAAVTLGWLVLIRQVDLAGRSTREAPKPDAGEAG